MGYDTAGSFTRGAYRCLDTRRTYRWLQRLLRCVVPAVPVVVSASLVTRNTYIAGVVQTVVIIDRVKPITDIG